jgi:hypothetical protein
MTGIRRHDALLEVAEARNRFRYRFSFTRTVNPEPGKSVFSASRKKFAFIDEIEVVNSH